MYKRVGVSQVEVYERVVKSVIEVSQKDLNQNISNRRTLRLYHLIGQNRVAFCLLCQNETSFETIHMVPATYRFIFI